MVVGRVGVKIGLRAIDRDLAQQTRFGELMQSVVDGCERDRDACAGRLFVELFGGDVPVALAE
jgi:hypothetical protein